MDLNKLHKLLKKKIMSTTMSKVFNNDEMKRILSEFKRLDGKYYVDNAGTALYPESLIKAINADLTNNLYQNPHSDKFTADSLDQIRYKILNFFNTNPEEYTVIFVSGATAALKLVAESFEFNKNPSQIEKKGCFSYLLDNHTSVLGMREYAVQKNANISYVRHQDFVECINSELNLNNSNVNCSENALFVYPGQNNFNGYKYSLEAIKKIKDGVLNKFTKKCHGSSYKNWYVMLDAASYVSTSRLDLSVYRPDFLCLSFYKIFGFPNGIGALLIKNSSADVLSQKTYYGGGTIDILLSEENYHVKKTVLNERLEDGSLPFLSILILKHCLNVFHQIIPKKINNNVMDTISHHTFHLARDLYKQFKNLKHGNGQNAVELYMDSEFDDIKKQGGIVTFNLLRANGKYIGYMEVYSMASLFEINLRTGCLCNSGSCQRHLQMASEWMMDLYQAGHLCGDEMDLHMGRPTGCVRISFGYHNTYKDVDQIVKMIQKTFVTTSQPVFIPDRTLITTANKEKEMKIVDSLVNSIQNFSMNKNVSLNFQTEAYNKINDGVLKEIHVYPIKSCGAFKIKSSWLLSEKGFLYDRCWMIVDDKGSCITQKKYPEMCLIKPAIDLDKQLLILRHPDMSPLSIPLNNNKYKIKPSTLCQSKVCNDRVIGLDCGDEAADWISVALGVAFLRLIKQSNDDIRKVKLTNNSSISSLNFSNQAQYLLINRATVLWLKKKVSDTNYIDHTDDLVDRFRGNLIVETDVALEERDWDRIIIDNHIFKVDGPCTRCQMVCIDQNTGTKTIEPLRTISEQLLGKLQFGIYLSYVGTIDNRSTSTITCNSIMETEKKLTLLNNNDTYHPKKLMA